MLPADGDCSITRPSWSWSLTTVGCTVTSEKPSRSSWPGRARNRCPGHVGHVDLPPSPVEIRMTTVLFAGAWVPAAGSVLATSPSCLR